MMDVMRASRSWVLVAAVGVFGVAAGSAWASDMGQAAVAQVTETDYRYFLGEPPLGMPGILYTHSGDDRGFGPEHDLARANIVAEFQSYGLSVALEPFTYSSTTYYNVVATMPGTTYPNREYIIGAHFDSVSNPGADDNASGTAAVLLAASIVSQYDSESTIRFIAFDREEQGLIGSYAYVADHPGADVRAMIAADMVAYDPNTDNALIYGRSTSLPLKNALGSAITLYGDGLTYTDGGWNGQSDHAPFDAAGYQACLLIEGQVWSNPYYHTQQDTVNTLGYINYAYATKMTRALVGYLVDNAGVLVNLADGDYDDNCDVDLFDYAWLQVCFSGDFSPYPAGMGCEDFDFDGDDDVDPADYAEFYIRLTGPTFEDCNSNGFADEYDIAQGHSQDCNTKGIPDECELAGNDCNSNGTPDECELAGNYCDENGVPDECDTDCNSNGVPDQCELTVVFQDDFETDQGWIAENLGATSGDWERGVPVNDPNWPYDPISDSDGSGQCYLTENQLGNTDVDDGAVRLTSPFFNTSVGNVTISYDYYLNLTDPAGGVDRLLVEIDTSAVGSWIEIARHDTGGGLGWRQHVIDQAALDALGVTLSRITRLRITATDAEPQSIYASGVDAVLVTVFDCGG